MSLSTLLTLAELHYEFGLIGINEYEERYSVADWLYGDHEQDIAPREEYNEEQAQNSENEIAPDGPAVTMRQGDPNSSDENAHLSFVANFGRKIWVFTKSDRDPYPSTPHGHWKSPKNKWPKLDPYTGRAFKKKNQEDKSKRLTKAEMKLLWDDEKFKGFCRDYLIWYREEFRCHTFRVPRQKLFRFPHW